MNNPPVVRKLTASLFVAQSLAQLGLTAALTVGPIAASRLAGSALAGLPTTLLLLGAAAAAYPAGRFMDRVGRRNGIVAGFVLSLCGGALAVAALIERVFPHLLFGFVMLGLGRAAIDQGRFAAAEVVTSEHRARAVSLFVLGGTVGGIGGPLVVGPMGALARSLQLDELAGPYLAAVVLFIVGGLVAFALLRPDPRDVGRLIASGEATAEGRAMTSVPRPLAEILRLRPAQVAVAAMVLGQLVMVAVMVMTPLHMVEHNHDLGAISWVIAAHVTGMFGLSLVSGRAADKYGRGTAIVVGCVLLVVACAAAPLVQSVFLLAVALFLLGLGWNFCYVAGSSLLADLLRPDERGKAQGANDLLVSLTSAVGSLGSGFVFAMFSYGAIAVGGIVIALGLLAFAALQERPRPAEAGAMD